MALAVPEHLDGDTILLRRYRVSDVDAVLGSIDASFAELNRWMPWAAQRPTLESVRAFVHPSAEVFGGETADANYAIVVRDSRRFVGSCGLMQQDVRPSALEIGYWVDSRYTRRGIATEAARLLTDEAFALDGIERVEIRCDAENSASARVPAKLGFALEVVEKVQREDGSAAQRMTWVLRRPARSIR